MENLILLATIIGWFSLVAIFFGNKHIRAIYEKFQGAVNKTLGGFLILLGINVALARD